MRRFRLKATFQAAWGYQGDNMNLPVAALDEAIPFYQDMMNFQVISRDDSPVKSAVLARDEIQLRLAENGGDASRDGCFFQVDNVQAAFDECKANGFQKEQTRHFRLRTTATLSIKFSF